ncbi:hypothetical protein M513_12013 [Trichuris suis]|uniref:Uncharacterized protein n=1 Tax=Trichuris suis TaxID=68888 RepID=A0A085LQ57_9BILA|nr:hypothetical protein M513_12011 [Trichuris suis]KFD47103.1 hypothetical protein M513_12013 [Trichuris suis]
MRSSHSSRTGVCRNPEGMECRRRNPECRDPECRDPERSKSRKPNYFVKSQERKLGLGFLYYWKELYAGGQLPVIQESI